MLSATRIIGYICMWAACDRYFPFPDIMDIRPIGSGPPIISTGTGKVSGYFMNTFSSQLIGAYEGIPYAESPIGQLRFHDPIPKRHWNGTLRANRRIKCIQMDPSRYSRVIGQEDCLVLNVYTPLHRNDENSNVPVLVWIHGGSWHWGAGSQYGPAYLLDYNIILVTFNYRLGPLGFLSSGGVSGNFGLKDQALALQWIKNNIQKFGGNSEKITLIGQSAGGASVHFHMMSPLSKGNFQSAISLSGTAMSFWALPPNQRLLSNRLAKSLGCPSSFYPSVIDCLRERPAAKIVSRQYDLYELLENPSVLFGPVVESNSTRAFLPDSPIELYRSGKVANIPWITGILRDEGELYSLANYAAPLALRTLVRNLKENLPVMLIYNKNLTEATEAIYEFYFGKSPISSSFGGFEFQNGISQMFGDRYFYVPFHHALQIHSRSITAPLYAYYFTFDGKHSLAEKINLPAGEWGVVHQDDLQYLFNCSELFYPIEKREKDFVISKYVTDLVVSFATKGIPVTGNSRYADSNEVWVPFSANYPKLLEINLRLQMTNEPNLYRINFWKSIENIFK